MNKLIRWLGLGILLLGLSGCTKTYPVVFLYNATLLKDGIYIIVNQTQTAYSVVDVSYAIEYDAKAVLSDRSIPTLIVNKTDVKIIDSHTKVRLDIEWF